MYEYSTDPGSGQSCGRRPGLWRTVLMVIAVAVVVSFALGAVFWVLGLALHLAGLLVRVALVTAVVAFVWRRVAGRSARRRSI